jgi:hypothetical protein
MGWTGGALQGPFTSLAAIEFDLGAEFAARVIEKARYGTVIYAAVRSREGDNVFALVLLAERREGILYTKPVSEDMGPAEDRCPAHILDLLTAPSNDWARKWRERCRARLAQPKPCRGQKVVFAEPITFTNGESHSKFTYDGGSRFHTDKGGSVTSADGRSLGSPSRDRRWPPGRMNLRTLLGLGSRPPL